MEFSGSVTEVSTVIVSELNSEIYDDKNCSVNVIPTGPCYENLTMPQVHDC